MLWLQPFCTNPMVFLVYNILAYGASGWHYNPILSRKANVPRECADVTSHSFGNGVYTIYPFGTSNLPSDVYCMFYQDGSVGTVFQRRFNGQVDFHRDWTSYKEGFGNASGEYWLGNEVLHALTASGPHVLKVVLKKYDGTTKYANYTSCTVTDESDNYRLTVGQYSGTAHDCLGGRWNNMQFSTFDRDNDKDEINCAIQYKGAWWNEECHCANLNGPYLAGYHNSSADGLDWYDNHYSYKESTMMLIKNASTLTGPRECSDLKPQYPISGVYTIYPFGTQSHPKYVFCEFSGDGTVWTVFQRRFNGRVDFYRNWTSYKEGFGSASDEYWLGNDALHALTTYGAHSLKVILTKYDGETKYAEYGNCTVADESDNYRLTVAQYSGDANDCLGGRWNNMQFSTFDRDNDKDEINCAIKYKGAWWNEECHCANLNGPYLGGHHDSHADGMDWDNIHYSYKESMMMIRRVQTPAAAIIG